MKVRFLKSVSLEELRANVDSNLERYRSGNFDDLAADHSMWFEVNSEYDPKGFEKLKPPKGGNFYEQENCLIFYNSFNNITPYEARDERLWAYLSHTYLFKHAQQRWKIPDDDEQAVRHIRNHFFASNKRSLERDNVASRLWWMAHLCGRVKGLDRSTVLEVLLHKADVRANIVERPTVSQSLNVFSVLIQKLKSSLDADGSLFERNKFRPLMKEINSVGGFKLLECLPEKDLHKIIDTIAIKVSN
jgi:hypothetical protein